MTKGRVVASIESRETGWKEIDEGVVTFIGNRVVGCGETAGPSTALPGFPVEVGGVGELHAAFFNGKPHTWTLVRAA
jgi:hypothetical protein